jgi:hypothetical protein
MKNYFADVYHRNFYLFLIIELFTISTLVISQGKAEITPFYIWQMYSTPMKNTDSTIIYQLEYNDKKKFNIPQIWNHHKRIMFNYTIYYYDHCIHNNFKDPASQKVSDFLTALNVDLSSYLDRVYVSERQIKDYPNWLKRYMQSLIKEEIHSIKVFKIWVAYQNDGRVKEYQRTVLCEA